MRTIEPGPAVPAAGLRRGRAGLALGGLAVPAGALAAACLLVPACHKPAPATGFAPVAVAVAGAPASSSMLQMYGISQWKLFSGLHHSTVTGYGPDGSAVQGFDVAWFPRAADGTPGYLRLTMLDGSGAIVRRYVGGRTTGELSPSQIQLLSTEMSDFNQYFVAEAREGASTSNLRGMALDVGTLHSLDMGTGAGAQPNTGPQCMAAQSGVNSQGVSCAMSASADWDPLAWAMTASNCGAFEYEALAAANTCAGENAQNCSADGTAGQSCDFSGSQPTLEDAAGPAPQQQLTQQDLCANYPGSSSCPSLAPTDGSCTANSDCTVGDTCGGGYCVGGGYTGTPGQECSASTASTDPACPAGQTPAATSTDPTDQQIQPAVQNNACLSCPPGASDVTADPKTGAVTGATPASNTADAGASPADDDNSAVTGANTGTQGQSPQQGTQGQNPQQGTQGQNPQGTQGQNPQGTQGQNPQGTQGQNPQGTQGQNPQGTQGQNPQGTQGQNPQGTQGQNPQGTQGQNPQGTQGQSAPTQGASQGATQGQLRAPHLRTADRHAPHATEPCDPVYPGSPFLTCR